MIQRCLTIILLMAISTVAISQNSVIRGTVTDSRTKETLVGVNVRLNETTGTTTDLNGSFSLDVEPGNYSLTFSFIGYGNQVKGVTVKAGETRTVDMILYESAEELDLVVVSGAKFSRKLSEETVSIEVLKSDLIDNVNAVTLAESIDKIAGVEIFDNQATIRGGSGYAFGVGSRVLLLIDDLPLLSVDRSEIRWTFIPLETTEQVEVLKSASSALYGAAALNGVINVRTSYPTEEPETKAKVYYNAFALPRKKGSAWWTYTSANPMRYGGTFSHKQRFGNVDVVAGASFNKTVGYIRLLDPYHARLTMKIRHRPEKIKGLSYGLDYSFMDSREGDYIFWSDADSGAYIPFGSDGNTDRGTLQLSNRKTILIDPWVKYFDPSGNRHSLRLRYNYVDVVFTSFPNPYSHLMLGEYQFQRHFNFDLNVTAGMQQQYYRLRDPRDLGLREGSSSAFFGQLDQKIRNFNAILGLRYEVYNLDKQSTKGRPLLSAGLNYQPGKATYLRASFGQGYRFPGIAERFVDNAIDPVRIYPNLELRPEYGFNAELGVKQGIKISNWLAYLDFSLFWMEYWDEIEFVFGFHDSPREGTGIGFKAENINRARITGFEATVFGDGKLGKIPLRWQAGYTYNYPVDLSYDTTLVNFGNYMSLFFKSIGSQSEEVQGPMLKYRSRHLFKSDIEADIWNFTFGVDTRFYGFIESIDGVFGAFIPGLRDYREENDTGDWVLNLRASYNMKKYGKIAFIVNNATNNFYTIRPARMEAPMNFVFQYSIKI